MSIVARIYQMGILWSYYREIEFRSTRKYRILSLSGTLKGPRKIVLHSECPT